MKSNSKISIITPSYNQGQFIEETIISVLDQKYPNLEYIIIDGGSTDNSVSIIKKYERFLKFWVSEPDNGQTHAINKGLKYCTGSIFNWLNSDDYLEPHSLHRINEAFSDINVQMVAGVVRNFSDTNEEFIQNQKLSADGLMCWKEGVKFVQPGVWLRKELIEMCGGIDEQYHYSFDWDLYIRYLYFFPVVSEIPDLLVHFRLHEQSKTQSLIERFETEQRKIIEKLYFLPQFEKLHQSCRYKIEKTAWTKILSKASQSDRRFLGKCLTVLNMAPEFKKVAFTRQTLGAFRAFWNNKII
jgi:glycosyltransferase involved in cell wall biosynthesis